MKLSIVIPTLNRVNLLKVTLEYLLPQVLRNLDKVELIISINASEDNTFDYMCSIKEKFNFIKIYSFDNRVEISASFSRSILLCNGEYILIFGDDDLPAPFMVESILSLLVSKIGVSILHFNRLIATDITPRFLNKCRIERKQISYSNSPQSLKEFIEDHNISPGFISSLVFKKDAWGLGVDVDNSTHYGYEFLTVIYNGVSYLPSPECLYEGYPLVLQRMNKNREWNDKWPKYWLMGVPSLLKSMDDLGITQNSLKSWYEELNGSTFKFIYTLMWASTYRDKYIPLIPEISKFQNSIFRKVLIRLIILLSPKFAFIVIRNVLYKKTI